MPQTVEKFCKHCERIALFYKTQRGRCIDCNRAYDANYRAANPDRVQKYNRTQTQRPEHAQRVSKSRKKRRRQDRKYREREISINRKVALRRQGLSEEAYDKMLSAQQGVCAICKQPERSKRMDRLRRLAVDHDHQTGRIRGLLCNACNRGLGLFQDNPEALEAAAIYLRQENPTSSRLGLQHQIVGQEESCLQPPNDC